KRLGHTVMDCGRCPKNRAVGVLDSGAQHRLDLSTVQACHNGGRLRAPQAEIVAGVLAAYPRRDPGRTLPRYRERQDEGRLAVKPAQDDRRPRIPMRRYMTGVSVDPVVTLKNGSDAARLEL